MDPTSAAQPRLATEARASEILSPGRGRLAATVARRSGHCSCCLADQALRGATQSQAALPSAVRLAKASAHRGRAGHGSSGLKAGAPMLGTEAERVGFGPRSIFKGPSRIRAPGSEAARLWALELHRIRLSSLENT